MTDNDANIISTFPNLRKIPPKSDAETEHKNEEHKSDDKFNLK
jgi:hypothetical protein